MKFSFLILVSLVSSLSVEAGELIYLGKTQKIAQVKNSNVLEKAKEILGIEGQFRIVSTQNSILGSHFSYQQTHQGYDIDGAEMAISVDGFSRILKIYHSFHQLRQNSDSLSAPLITQEKAMELAWIALKGSGELKHSPEARLLLNKNLNFFYKVTMDVSAPYGSWEIKIDAHDGKMISIKEASLPRMKRRVTSKQAKIAQTLKSFSQAFKSFEAKRIFKLLDLSSIKVNGSAQIFDPNPVVALGRSDLKDSSPASAFRDAYQTADLLDISLKNGVYQLLGSKVAILDFDAPRKAVTTSVDGSWVFERGQSGFTDAMTYVHLDRSVRYLEALGFKGSRAIFRNPIQADADGEDGEDNSSFSPSSGRLSFGHGKIDDNEDADVILHELGHAIQFYINSSWDGGDTGAMGEGFGDYWAASYSADLPRGMNYHPEWVFKWDGHNEFWPGRKLDVVKLKYDPHITYEAHEELKDGISDELWSTPLFQAFLELRSKGVSKANIDKIILEAHFGLGSGVKIPQMATSIVNTAKALFPAKDYDKVFARHFQNQKIL